ncbi:MAG: hypothetical protein ACREGH_01625, partial [Minisyncoccia bacterium]
MRLDYAVKDLKEQGWFDPFKEASRDAVYPLPREFRAAWEELEALANSPDTEFFVVPKHLWPIDELGEPSEQGWFGWDYKRRRMLVYGQQLASQLEHRIDLQLRYQRLLTLAQNVNDNALNIAREFAQVMDAHTGGKFGLSDALKRNGSAVTRFLRYRPNPERLNPEHLDRSFLTVHAWESHDGLWLKSGSHAD